MGLESIGAGLVVGGGLFEGVNAYDEANRQARQVMIEGDEKAQLRKREISKFQSEQELAYLKSGVLLDGSPLLVLEETRREGLKEVLGIRHSARETAKGIRRRGQARLFASILNSSGDLFRAISGGGGTPGGKNGGTSGEGGYGSAGGNYNSFGNYA